MKNWDRTTYGFGALALAVILYLAVNIYSSATFRNARLDLTSGKLYSLSDGTLKVLSELKEPVTLRYFVSRDLLDASPGLGTYSSRVRELIQRYVTLSKGMIQFEIIDPKPFSTEEDRAVGFGLKGVPLNETGELGYLGLAGNNTTDDQDVIGFLQPQREQFLEYDLTRLIYNLAHPNKKTVGLVSGLPIDADPLKKYKPWAVIEQMKQFFEVRSMGLEPKITDDIDVLMIVHPIGLTEKALYAIDQFVLRGGKTMVFVDPYAEEGTRSNQAMRLPPDQGSDLDTLFKGWGINYTTDKVMGDLGSAQRVSAGVDSLGKPIITDYVSWVTLRPERMNKDDVVTGELRLINMASAGIISKAKDAPITFEPLISSSKDAAPVDAKKVRFQPDPSLILKTFKPLGKSLVMAARIGGKMNSAYPKGPPKPVLEARAKAAKDGPKEGEKPAKVWPHLKVAKDGVNMIVVADTDILADNFWLQVQDFFGQRLVVPSANNGDFVNNALDNLSGSSALIGLRSRGLSSRPFVRVQNIQKAAEVKFRDREQALNKELADIQKKLKSLQTKEQGGGATILTPKQAEAITKFRGQILKLRRDLRQVRLALREDIDRLDAWTKIINIGGMPVLVALLAIILAMVRRGRTRRRIIAAHQ
jgi:ABC-type uncharacterized transport system involved in gliding motility auxiliary subunit